MSDANLNFDHAEFSQLPLFATVSIFDIEDILRRCPVLVFEAGHVIIGAGQPNERMYIVLDGEVGVRFESLDSEAVAILCVGDVIGELSVIDTEPTSAYVVAEQRCRLLAVDRDTLWELFRRSPYIAYNMLSILTHRIRESNARFI